MRLIDQDEVRERLTYEVAIPIVRAAMIALSSGQTRQHLRSIIPLADGRMFGIMPGALGERGAFGAKLISIFPENFALGQPSHQGVVILFDPDSGAPICVAHAGEVTAIRTAAASAVATGALARPEARRLAILGYGEQAETHLRALRHVRPIDHVTVWGRSPERAGAFAARMAAETGLPVVASVEVESAVAQADIICTVSGAQEPILKGVWVAPGTHLNLVGSSRPGPVEVDEDLVAACRFIADSREGVLAQGAEFLNARASGRVRDDHVVGEIGQVLSGAIAGRQSVEQITAYKSLGHIVQDLASVQALLSGRA
ncbi:ornithine cyclodeaminase family protein [Phenylobacterium sp.]|uniref:ornithine cyclodeaminase family protein n=1 Tax=Phenylobacterium sp. TaxID=1871053 RepID=UPI00271C00DA|nr:ornithine cyclodeaminase family protein [Phenylobacterium sp.]MDO8801993.1 ornithine cyclodeaminase family protein [Phenylobacterium sp.]